MNPWTTTFDVAVEPFHWGNAGEGLAALALIAAGVAISLALRQRRARGATAVLALACGVAAFFTVRTLDHLGEHEACLDAARRGDGRVVEGRVERVRASGAVWPWSAAERLEVGGQEIRYPVLSSACGFSRREAQAAGVREGAEVRLRLWRDEVLKVEVADAARASRRAGTR